MIITHSQLHTEYWFELTLNTWCYNHFGILNRNWAALFLQSESQLFKLTTIGSASNLQVNLMLDELLDPSRNFMLDVVDTTSQRITAKITTTKHSNLDSVIQELRSISLLELL